MRYHAQYDNNGTLLVIGTGSGGIEITEAEYKAFLAIIREKAALVDSLYNREITIVDVPEEWQEEIQHRVDELIAMQDAIEKGEEATEADYIDALENLGVSFNE